MTTHRCDVCGEVPALRVVYGYPSAELVEESLRGEVVLGGCIIEEKPSRWLCRPCASKPSEEEDALDEVLPDLSN